MRCCSIVLHSDGERPDFSRMGDIIIKPATDEERPWAAMLLSESEPWIKLGITLEKCNQTCHDPEYQNYRAVNLLFYEIIKDSISKWLSYLDFGLFTVNMEPNWGLGKFKENFGARGILRDTFYLNLEQK